MDARSAALQTRSYFEDVHGSHAVLLFQVHNVDRTEEGGWRVRCSFFPSTMAADRRTFDIELDDSGVTRVSEESEAPVRSP